jgi:hypothetical protein
MKTGPDKKKSKKDALDRREGMSARQWPATLEAIRILAGKKWNNQDVIAAGVLALLHSSDDARRMYLDLARDFDDADEFSIIVSHFQNGLADAVMESADDILKAKKAALEARRNREA